MIRKVLLRIGGALVLILAIVFVTISLRWDRHFDAPYPKLAASTDSAVVARGRYLAYGPAHCAACHTAYLVSAVSNCAGCHTQRNMMTGAFTGPRLAGGVPMETGSKPSIQVTPPDITADSTGRATLWTEDEFVARFHAGERIPGSPMPWVAFRRMGNDDLRAIYRYLRTVRRVS